MAMLWSQHVLLTKAGYTTAQACMFWHVQIMRIFAKAVSCIFAFSLFSLTFHIWIRGFASCPTFPRNDLKNSLSSLGYLRCLRYA